MCSADFSSCPKEIKSLTPRLHRPSFSVMSIQCSLPGGNCWVTVLMVVSISVPLGITTSPCNYCSECAFVRETNHRDISSKAVQNARINRRYEPDLNPVPYELGRQRTLDRLHTIGPGST